MAYGLTDEGFAIKTLAIIKDEIDAALKAALGKQINTLPEGVYGQLIGIYAERESLIWELAESIYNSQYPDTAEGVSLDNVGALTGVTRLPAIASIVEVKLFGTATTVVPKDTTYSVDGDPTAKFDQNADVTLIAGTDEVQNIDFGGSTPTSGSFKLTYRGETTAAINWDDAAADVQTALRALNGLSEVTVSGTYPADFVVTFAGADGKQIQPLLGYADNTLDDGSPVTITITETTPGVDQGLAQCTAQETGPTVANAYTLTVIDTPVSGLDSVRNVEDATLGRDIESCAAYRSRRQTELQISRAGPTEAIRGNVLDLNDDETKNPLDSVTIIENTTGTVDAGDRPGKSFEVFVAERGGLTTRDQEVAQAIFESKPAGIESFGDVSKTVTDSQGFEHTIKFSRPTEVDIWLILDLTTTSEYPTNGDDQVKALMVTWGNELGVGQDIIVYPDLVGQLAAIPGITDVGVKIGLSDPPTLDDNIPIDDGTGGDAEISAWDTARITVNS